MTEALQELIDQTRQRLEALADSKPGDGVAVAKHDLQVRLQALLDAQKAISR